MVQNPVGKIWQPEHLTLLWLVDLEGAVLRSPVSLLCQHFVESLNIGFLILVVKLYTILVGLSFLGFPVCELEVFQACHLNE